MEYLGHDAKYWLELEKRVEELGVVDWLKEISELMAKITFYESRIKQMNELMNKSK